VARQQRLPAREAELEAQARAHAERISRANEDAARTHVRAVTGDEGVYRFTLELDAESDPAIVRA